MRSTLRGCKGRHRSEPAHSRRSPGSGATRRRGTAEINGESVTRPRSAAAAAAVNAEAREHAAASRCAVTRLRARAVVRAAVDARRARVGDSRRDRDALPQDRAEELRARGPDFRHRDARNRARGHRQTHRVAAGADRAAVGRRDHHGPCHHRRRNLPPAFPRAVRFGDRDAPWAPKQ